MYLRGVRPLKGMSSTHRVLTTWLQAVEVLKHWHQTALRVHNAARSRRPKLLARSEQTQLDGKRPNFFLGARQHTATHPLDMSNLNPRS